MVRNKEGGVCTKKIIVAIAIFAMVFAAGAVILDSADETDAATSSIRGDTNVVKVSGQLKYDIIFQESESFSTLDITYTATMKNTDGGYAGSISPSSGALSNGVSSTLTVTAPSSPGKYILSVTFVEKIDGGEGIKSEKSVTITVVKPVSLTSKLTNNSNVDFTDFAVYFVVDGERVDDSRSLISVKAKGETTVSYDWVTESASGTHSFNLVAGEENIGDYSDIIIGEVHEFYFGHSDYKVVNILLVIILVVLALVVIYFYRKPVKNYGKPKSRR